MSSTHHSHHSVVYTAKSQAHQHRALSLERLKEMGIRFVRVTWVDLTNTTRMRVMPMAYLSQLAAARRPGVTMIRATFGAVGITLGEGFTSAGEYLYVLDMTSVRVCPYAPGHASIMGYFEEKAPVTGADGMPTVTVDLCPRTTLQRIVR